MNSRLFRIFDLFFSVVVFLLLLPLAALITLACALRFGSPIFKQRRVGKDMREFTLYKFRTMNLSTPSVSTHLIDGTQIGLLGNLLRVTKLDELPQLVNVIFGNMSLVGPRPSLLTQDDVIRERTDKNIYDVKPGITGISQLKKIDMSMPHELAVCDRYMIDNFSVNLYFSILFKTALGKGAGDQTAR